MWETISGTISEYLGFYASYGQKRWSNMTPVEYGTLLIFIGVVGWLMMKNAGRR